MIGEGAGGAGIIEDGGTVSESDGHGNTRRSPRVEPPGEFVVLVESFGQFLEQHARDISEGGMFLRSQAPPPPGTRLRFAIRLADGFPLIQGEGEVVWRRERREGPFDPPGMGVRFLSLEEQGRELVRRLVEERRRMLESGDGTSGEAGSRAEPAPAGRQARQAPGQLLEVPEPGSGAAGGVAGGEGEDPFGPLEPPPEEGEVPAAGSGPFHLGEGSRPGPEAPATERGGDAGPGPENGNRRRPASAGDPWPARGDELPGGAPASGREAGSTLPPAEMPEIGRPAGYYDEEEPLPPSRGRWFWPFAVIVAVLALAALGYGAWQLGYLAWAGLPAPAAGERAGWKPGWTPTPGAVVPSPVPTAGETPTVPAGATEDRTPTPEPTEIPPPRPTEAPSPRPAGPSPTAAPGGAAASPARSVRRLTWTARGDAVEVHILFDGRIRRSRVHLTRLDGPPRVLLRIVGIRRQYEPTEIQVGAGPLERVRVWLHDEFRPPELYVVLDLHAAAVQVRRRLQGPELVVTVR